MAQFAPVAPIQILEELKKQNALGTYHLLLAHHVLEYPERFRALFADLSGCTIIMDNSIVELGDAENEQKVLDACAAIQDGSNGRNWIFPVLTDVMGDGPATREKAHASYYWWMEHAPNYDLMVVLQGNDFQDFCVTADKFLLDPQYDRITYAGIPRKLVALAGTRKDAIRYVDSIRPDISVHLLGFSDNNPDDIICANHPSVEGIDSAVPIRYDGRFTPTVDAGPRDPNWFATGQYNDQIFRNLANMRTWVA